MLEISSGSIPGAGYLATIKGRGSPQVRFTFGHGGSYVVTKFSPRVGDVAKFLPNRSADLGRGQSLSQLGEFANNQHAQCGTQRHPEQSTHLTSPGHAGETGAELGELQPPLEHPDVYAPLNAPRRRTRRFSPVVN